MKTQSQTTPRSSIRINAFPTAGGAISRAAYARAIQAGIDADRLLRLAGIRKVAIKDRTVRIRAGHQIKFLNLVAEATGDEFLGIGLAEHFELRELGLLYYVQSSSEKLGNALQRLARYSTIHNEGVDLHYDERDHITIAFDYVGIARTRDRHQVEFFIVTLIRLCRAFAGRLLTPKSVRLMHRRSTIPAKWKALFGCNVEFGSNRDEVSYEKSIASLPVIGADPHLNSILEGYCKETLSRRNSKPGAWRLRVENALASVLPHGEAGLGEIAKKLGVSPRTLIRVLAAEGQTFSNIVQSLRGDLARRYLRETRLSVSEIAWLVGYREASAFSHAFKRWTGKTPNQSRG